ncbi:NADH dehydrogenase [ubiquinone] iron-sulfur protein 6, mitochondrial [Hyalella azteca]|uniref:NADH dehydrogenase [ubiquinone] iron-sulfur protein 6, mitochondrial n=1 Tax=Hyalella azteca TaxID=294128 RepID=A0A8B7NXL6_HYAAZ|nr:NADH dehydrogenase [ubiquinone] iron-sulfur protein 6, mitochondrial [Hyalella azteca]
MACRSVSLRVQLAHLTRSKSLGFQPSQVLGFRCLTSQRAEGQDLVTHTGQSWSPDDYRNVRFLDNPKQVNSRWSIDLIKAVPPVVVEGRTAVCEGGPSEALGHPKIYINLDQPGNHSCSYCGIRFVKKETAH